MVVFSAVICQDTEFVNVKKARISYSFSLKVSLFYKDQEFQLPNSTNNLTRRVLCSEFKLHMVLVLVQFNKFVSVLNT